MPTTRKQKKARKSKGLEMLSDIENLDIMLVENHFDTGEREGSLNSNFPRGSRTFVSNESENEDGNMSEIRESPTQGLMPSSITIQLLVTLVLR